MFDLSVFVEADDRLIFSKKVSDNTFHEQYVLRSEVSWRSEEEV